MWNEIKHTIGTDGRVENYIYEYIINFPPSTWNKKETSPIIKIRLHDYKTETGWWLDKEKTKWHTQPPNKVCHIEFGYFQRQTDLTISSFSDETPDYEDFTLEFCKEYALRIFKRRVNDVLNQINIIDTNLKIGDMVRFYDYQMAKKDGDYSGTNQKHYPIGEVVKIYNYNNNIDDNDYKVCDIKIGDRISTAHFISGVTIV